MRDPGGAEGTRRAGASAEAAAGRVLCLPSALVLTAPSCGAAPARLVGALSQHPNAVGLSREGTPPDEPAGRPWWSHASLRNLTGAPSMRRATARVLRDASRRLLLQHAPLDARTVRLAADQRRAGLGLADVLPRVQRGLRVLVCLCDPARRLQRAHARHGVPPTAAAAARRAFDECAARHPAAHCAARADARLFGGGLYPFYLREILRALPASQVRALRVEDLERRPRDALREALAFFGLSDGHGDASALAALAREIAAGAATEAAPAPAAPTAPMWAAAASMYEEELEELVDLMDGDERFRWPPPPPPPSPTPPRAAADRRL